VLRSVVNPVASMYKSNSERLCRLGGALVSLFIALITPAHGDVPLGLPAMRSAPDAAGLAELGRRIFSDTRFSVDGKISCATCHISERRFTDGRATARGLRGRELTRKTPSLLNVRYQTSLFWDGRAQDLATQVRAPLLGPLEHALRDETVVGQIARQDESYAAAFARLLHVPKADLSLREVSLALVAFEKTLVAGDSPFDRYEYGHDRRAMTPTEIRGLELFRGRARCESCHRIGENSALFTDGEFHASPVPIPALVLAQLGELTSKVATLRSRGEVDALNALIAGDRDVAALGRFVVTLQPKDIGAFKTPSLRNVALLGPYMHDGSIEQLAQAIEFELYSRSRENYPLVLTEDERADLLQFLQALTSR
jgi:cytochrome c peroxidase